MIRKLVLTGFRCFPHLEMSQLGRVNLLVGKNNSGKTSVLEAAELATSGGDPFSLYRIIDRRGERFWERSDSGRATSELEVSHLFYRHVIAEGSTFSIQTLHDAGASKVTATIAAADTPDLQDSLLSSDSDAFAQPLVLVIRGPLFDDSELRLLMTRRTGLSVDELRRVRREPPNGAPTTRFIATEALTPEEVTSLLDDILLTREEELVINALQLIEPGINRIASLGSDRRTAPYRWAHSRTGVVVKCAGFEERIPIGSMGEGIWRMLGLVLSIVRASGGTVLIDEIDTGLHFSVMADVWKLVIETSRRLGVQVFATTHSFDCIESLAAVCRDSGDRDLDVTIQRIEHGKSETIPFNEAEIIAAAERRIEIR